MADLNSHSSPKSGNAHEKSDANTGNLFKVTLGLLGLIVGSMVAMFILWKVFEKYPPPVTSHPSEIAQKSVLPPAPRLQVHPAKDREEFQAKEDSILTTYGWVDRGSGLVRVPVESAIVQVAREGLPFDTSLARKR